MNSVYGCVKLPRWEFFGSLFLLFTGCVSVWMRQWWNQTAKVNLLYTVLLGLIMSLALGSAYISAYRSDEAKIVDVVDAMVGPSDVAATESPTIPPFRLDLVAGKSYKQVGQDRVYLHVVPGVTVVERPRLRGFQTFMYLEDSRAATQTFNFRSQLPIEAGFQLQPDGSLAVHDDATNLTIPAAKKPWATGVQDGVSYPTKFFTVTPTSFTQSINLAGASYPILADPEFDDPLTQLLEGRVPELKELEASTQKDGPSHNIGQYGRWYIGPNGLEIRLNNRGLLYGTKQSADVLVTVGSFGPYLKKVMEGSSSIVLTKLAALGLTGAVGAQLIGNHLEDVLQNDVMKNVCYGLTVPRDIVLRSLKALAARLPVVVLVPSQVKQWVEPCDSTKPLVLDKVAPPPPPVTNSGDVQPAVPANPMPQPTKNTTAPPKAPPAKHLVNHNVDMTEVCRRQYDSAAQNEPDRYDNFDDPHSWYCVDDAGNNLGGVNIQENFCDIHWNGSKAVPVDSNAHGWKCQRME